MGGYVASARLHGGIPRRTGGGADLDRAPAISFAVASSPTEPANVADRVELVGRPLDEVIADRLTSIGEAWSQLTFYLFDRDGWR
jgi:hypothetical protein